MLPRPCTILITLRRPRIMLAIPECLLSTTAYRRRRMRWVGRCMVAMSIRHRRCIGTTMGAGMGITIRVNSTSRAYRRLAKDLRHPANNSNNNNRLGTRRCLNSSSSSSNSPHKASHNRSRCLRTRRLRDLPRHLVRTRTLLRLLRLRRWRRRGVRRSGGRRLRRRPSTEGRPIWVWGEHRVTCSRIIIRISSILRMGTGLGRMDPHTACIPE